MTNSNSPEKLDAARLQSIKRQAGMWNDATINLSASDHAPHAQLPLARCL